MCRLLAYVAGRDRSVGDLLEPDELAGFKDLSRLHCDGWGMAWTSGDSAEPAAAMRSHRSLCRALDDPRFDELAAAPLGSAGLVHLRWATPGFAVVDDNTHPFLLSGWAFAHNGNIPRPERLDGLLEPAWSDRRRGTTDSERYFLYVLQEISRDGDIVAGVRRAVGNIRALSTRESLNAVLVGPERLVVIHSRAGTPSPRDSLLAAVARPDQVPPGHLENYYGLWWRRQQDAVVAASSGLGGPGWDPLPEDSVLVVDRRGLEATVHLLDPPPL
jgi:predicted glutamine amidotransferase